MPKTWRHPVVWLVQIVSQQVWNSCKRSMCTYKKSFKYTRKMHNVNASFSCKSCCEQMHLLWGTVVHECIRSERNITAALECIRCDCDLAVVNECTRCERIRHEWNLTVAEAPWILHLFSCRTFRLVRWKRFLSAAGTWFVAGVLCATSRVQREESSRSGRLKRALWTHSYLETEDRLSPSLRDVTRRESMTVLKLTKIKN